MVQVCITHVEPTSLVICFIRSKLSRTVLWHQETLGLWKTWNRRTPVFVILTETKLITSCIMTLFQCSTMSCWVWHCGPTSPPDFNLSDPQWGLQGATCQFVVIKLPDGEFHVNFYYPALLCVEQWNTINDSSYVVSQHKHNNITFYEVPRTRGSASQEKHRIVGSRDIFQ